MRTVLTQGEDGLHFGAGTAEEETKALRSIVLDSKRRVLKALSTPGRSFTNVVNAKTPATPDA